MILQFIGFFVVLGAGAFVLYWTGKESYFFLKYQLSFPLDADDLIGVFVMIILLCLGCGLIYYAGAHAPFTIALDFNLKV